MPTDDEQTAALTGLLIRSKLAYTGVVADFYDAHGFSFPGDRFGIAAGGPVTGRA